MPRYFFNVIDGLLLTRHGRERASRHSRRPRRSRNVGGEILREMGTTFWNGTEWRMEVADERHRRVFTLRFSAEEHLAPAT